GAPCHLHAVEPVGDRDSLDPDHGAGRVRRRGGRRGFGRERVERVAARKLRALQAARGRDQERGGGGQRRDVTSTHQCFVFGPGLPCSSDSGCCCRVSTSWRTVRSSSLSSSMLRIVWYWVSAVRSTLRSTVTSVPSSRFSVVSAVFIVSLAL